MPATAVTQVWRLNCQEGGERASEALILPIQSSNRSSGHYVGRQEPAHPSRVGSGSKGQDSSGPHPFQVRTKQMHLMMYLYQSLSLVRGFASRNQPEPCDESNMRTTKPHYLFLRSLHLAIQRLW
jgi:hypothetical protein